MALLTAVVAFSGCSRGHRPSTKESPVEPAAWNLLLKQIGPDGQVSRDTALAAFVLAIGPLPGVSQPPGADGPIRSGTPAVAWLLRYWSTLTLDQQQAARRALSAAPAGSVSAGALGPARAIARNGPVPALTPLPSPSVADPNVLCQSADTPHAAQYRPVVDTAVSDIAAHLGRQLHLQTYLSVNTENKSKPGALMYAVPCTAGKAGSPLTGCTIHINPRFFDGGYGPVELRATITHEVMHCFTFDLFGMTYRVLPPWLMEGSADWVAATLVSGDRLVRGDWKMYLEENTTSLFQRAYDAIGYYAHLAETGTGVWGRLDAMMAAYLNEMSIDVAADFAAWRAASPTDEFLDTWGSGFARGRRPGKPWNLTGPDVPADVMPEVARSVLGNDTTSTFEAGNAAANLIQVNLEAEVVQFTGDIAARGLLGTSDGSDHPLQGLLGNDYCTRLDRCKCPDNTPRAGTVLTSIAPGAAYLGFTGGLDAISVVAIGSSLDEYCKKSSRIDAIAKIIAQTSNEHDAYVEFHDVSDLPKDGVDRVMQLACDTKGCNVVVPCDDVRTVTCASIAGKLTPMGLVRDRLTYFLDYSLGTGSAHDFAVLTEKIFLQVLGASKDYKLTWQSSLQKNPVPLPAA